MNELLDEMEMILSDLVQSGFSTGTAGASLRAESLSEALASSGLHTAGKIMSDLAAMLDRRQHLAEKDDAPLMDTVCKAARYVELAREKQMQRSILDRWNNIVIREEFHESD